MQGAGEGKLMGRQLNEIRGGKVGQQSRESMADESD